MINLVVQQFPWGKDQEAFVTDVTNDQALETQQEELHLWCNYGPCGKLDNLLVYITQSPQSCDRFEEKVKQLYPNRSLLTVIGGNETQWGGEYTWILWALNLQETLEDIVSSAIRGNASGGRAETQYTLEWDELLTEDWDKLGEVVNILGLFQQWQLILHGRKQQGTLQDIFPAVAALISHLWEAEASLP